MAYFTRGEQWEDVNRELVKYYQRTYIKPTGPKHVLYLAWRHEWEQSQNVVYLPGRRAN